MSLTSWPWFTKKYTAHLSEDIQYQILSRITCLETLDRCKVVCKRWYDIIINEVSFMPSYYQNTGNLYGYLLQVDDELMTRKFSKALLSIHRRDKKCIPWYTEFDDELLAVASSNTNLKFDDDKVEIVASSMQGIVCCAKHKRDRYGEGRRQLFVGKPTTGQWHQVPSNGMLPGMVGLMILSNQPLKYKIIWISSFLGNINKHWLESYDSTTLKWSKSVGLSLSSSRSHFIGQGIQVGKFLYFLLDTDVFVFNGDNDNKTFQIPFPQTVSYVEMNTHPTIRKKLIEYQGKLGLICTTLLQRLSSVQLWILEDRQKTGMWKMVKEVDMSYLDLHTVYPVGCYNADILVLQNPTRRSLIFCNIHDFTCEELKLNNNLVSKVEIFPFRSDWEYATDHLNFVDQSNHDRFKTFRKRFVTIVKMLSRKEKWAKGLCR